VSARTGVASGVDASMAAVTVKGAPGRWSDHRMAINWTLLNPGTGRHGENLLSAMVHAPQDEALGPVGRADDEARRGRTKPGAPSYLKGRISDEIYQTPDGTNPRRLLKRETQMASCPPLPQRDLDADQFTRRDRAIDGLIVQ
jgi:hypothetical protein